MSDVFAGPANPWAVYKRRHSDLSDEENERFRILFGADFVNEYRQFASEARAVPASTRSMLGPGPSCRSRCSSSQVAAKPARRCR